MFKRQEMGGRGSAAGHRGLRAGGDTKKSSRRADAEEGFRIPVEAPCATALPSRSDGFGLRLREFEIDRALCHSQKYSLRRDEKRRWTVERHGAGSSIFLFFFKLLSPLDHVPMGPKTQPLGPWAHSSKNEGDRRESVCN